MVAAQVELLVGLQLQVEQRELHEHLVLPIADLNHARLLQERRKRVLHDDVSLPLLRDLPYPLESVEFSLL